MARPVGKRGESRARLLQTALRLFGERGVNGTSLQTIADELGVTKAAVYHQFASKDEIVLAVVEPAFTRMAELVREADAALRPAPSTSPSRAWSGSRSSTASSRPPSSATRRSCSCSGAIRPSSRRPRASIGTSSGPTRRRRRASRSRSRAAAS
ncbi:TetR/AcrR family transcriptional regulator [Rathayibacter oskolensis]|uniref:TetR/AcrR family transcriptional regulator n=1 Tax=Rathayibacter oskolensis TaxID=1891671 RepID=UPI002660304B|nr:TetR/AcrR family transcriptional regulator [Rathayibacter oskolensis]WKK70346.1 TetR/AcrR family transcriptional regulator [Rathayibacter oskolensis]